MNQSILDNKERIFRTYLAYGGRDIKLTNIQENGHQLRQYRESTQCVENESHYIGYVWLTTIWDFVFLGHSLLATQEMRHQLRLTQNAYTLTFQKLTSWGKTPHSSIAAPRSNAATTTPISNLNTV